MDKDGIQVDEDLHQNLITTINEKSSIVEEEHPPGSFLRLFWEQQKQASTRVYYIIVYIDGAYTYVIYLVLHMTC
jgi:hypothetical protein